MSRQRDQIRKNARPAAGLLLIYDLSIAVDSRPPRVPRALWALSGRLSEFWGAPSTVRARWAHEVPVQGWLIVFPRPGRRPSLAERSRDEQSPARSASALTAEARPAAGLLLIDDPAIAVCRRSLQTNQRDRTFGCMSTIASSACPATINPCPRTGP